MRRRLLNLLTVLSLLLCIAVCMLWVRSYWRQDDVGWAWAGRVDGSMGPFKGVNGRNVYAADLVVIQSADGALYTLYSVRESREQLGPFYRAGVPYPPTAAAGWRTFAAESHDVGPQSQRAVVFPHWTVAAAAAVLPGLQLIRWRRARRLRQSGHSPRCRYDLRATPGRCPECGHEPQCGDQALGKLSSEPTQSSATAEKFTH